MTVALDCEGLPDGIIRLRMQGDRANALVPAFIEALHTALDEVEAEAPRALVLSGGRNYCSGGDIRGFHEAAQTGKLKDYASALVPRLQSFVLRLLSAPFVVAAAARGAITGGGAGLLFASDLAVIGDDAFVQPYYNTVGFAPDGGWCALLPERIGLARAQSWIAGNRRVRAEELCHLGLAERSTRSSEVEGALVQCLTATDLDTLCAAKSIFWDAPRRAAVATRLDAETEAFLTRIVDPTMPNRLSGFLEAMKEARHV